MIAVLGAKESGTGAALLAKALGLHPFVSDSAAIPEQYKKLLLENNIDFEENNHSIDKILKAGLVIKSPGIPEGSPVIKAIRTAGVKIVSEIEFASAYSKAKKICITGSNGKTTTTSLTGHIFSKAGKHSRVAGNIGNSFAMELLKGDCEHFVLEISSFQLDDISDFKAETAILTNITPDHLDRYDYNIEKYAFSKFRITENQNSEDHFIYNADDELTQKYLYMASDKAQRFTISMKGEVEQGAYVKDNKIFLKINQTEELMFIQELALQGKHNVYNSMAAAVSARLYDIRNEEIKECLMDFKHIEHRMEFVARIHGIDFINDSKATNVNATWYALDCQIKPVVWIAGGQDKGNDYSLLKDLVKTKVKAIVCLGKDNSKIIESFSDVCNSIVSTSSMRQAVNTAYQLAKKDEVVLLSPACASFDLFKNYEDRGNQFKICVKEL